MTPDGPLIWLLLDDRAGNRSQCLGVAEALSLPFTTKELKYSLWAQLPNWLMGASFQGLTSECRLDLQEPWPDLVIAAGRRTGPVAREIKRRSGGRTKLVQIMWPGTKGIEEFDLVCVPNHDDIPEAQNVFRITGSPSSITPANVAELKGRYQERFSQLSAPKIALLCGGSTKNRQFTKTMANDLGRSVSALVRSSGGSLLVTTSRRTGDQADALIAHIDVPADTYRWTDGGENPYKAYLSVANVIVVTGESMSMCSEACSTGKPVYIYAPPELISDKHKRLHQELYKLGCARPLGQPYEQWSYAPLNAAQQIADQVISLVGRMS